MSKYNLLWEYIKKNGDTKSNLSFPEIKDILGFEIDHSLFKLQKGTASVWI